CGRLSERLSLPPQFPLQRGRIANACLLLQFARLQTSTIGSFHCLTALIVVRRLRNNRWPITAEFPWSPSKSKTWFSLGTQSHLPPETSNGSSHRQDEALVAVT